jgi:hypothetical protein
VILQRTGDDLGGRSRAAVDQDDHRLAAGQVARTGIEAAGFLGIAAAGRDDFATIEEGVGDADRLVEQTAGIEPKVEHEALELVLADFIGDLLDGIGEIVIGLFGERDHPEIADIFLDPVAHRLDGDDVAHNLDLDRLVGTFTQDQSVRSRC